MRSSLFRALFVFPRCKPRQEREREREADKAPDIHCTKACFARPIQQPFLNDKCKLVYLGLFFSSFLFRRLFVTSRVELHRVA